MHCHLYPLLIQGARGQVVCVLPVLTIYGNFLLLNCKLWDINNSLPPQLLLTLFCCFHQLRHTQSHLILFFWEETNSLRFDLSLTRGVAFSFALCGTVALREWWVEIFYEQKISGLALVPEFIDPVFAKTSPKRSFIIIKNDERFGLVYAKTGSINSGTGEYWIQCTTMALNLFESLNPRQGLPSRGLGPTPESLATR